MSEPRHARDRLDRGLGMLRRCLSFWRRALLVFVITAVVAGPYAVTRPRSYRSETVVLYQESIRSEDLTGSSGEPTSDSTRRLGARLREALLSRASLEPIIVDLHLYATVVERRGLVDAVEEMRKHITFRAHEGDTFEIAFEGTTPDEVQEATRRLGDCIVKEAAARRLEHAKVLKEFVDAENERNKIDLKSREAALAGFLAVHPELKRPAGADHPTPPATTTGAAPSRDDTTLPALEQRAARIEWQLRTAGRTQATRTDAPRRSDRAEPATPESPELVAARRDLADKLSKFTDRHPDVLAARARVRAAESAHGATGVPPQSVAEGAPPEVRPDERESLRQQLAVVHAQIAAARRANAPDASARAASAAEPPVSVVLEVEYRRLQREVNDARERQRQLDERQFKASITASSVMNDRNIQVSVLDPAYRPTHAFSRPRSTLLGAALLGCLLLALIVAVVSARIDDRIHDRTDLEAVDVVTVVGVVPRASSKSLRRSA